MKKSLIALAALATVATAAQAQSSVTIYGIVDVGVIASKGVYQSGTASDTSVTHVASPLATSRLGFRGNEDLGSGLSAGFNLELGFDPSLGAQTASAPLFDRAAFVSLSKANVGTVALGRMTRLDFDTAMAADPFGASNFGGVNGVLWSSVSYVGAGTDYSTNTSRFNNAVKLTSASFGGVTVGYQHAFGETAGEADISEAKAYSIGYAAGNARIGFASSRQNNTSGVKANETSVLAGSYDFGVLKAFAGFAQKEINTDTDKVKAKWVGLTAPVQKNITLVAQYTKLDNLSSDTAKNAKVYAVGALYALSNRTTAYVMAGQANNDPTAQASVGSAGPTGTSVTAGADVKAYTVGIRHSF